MRACTRSCVPVCGRVVRARADAGRVVARRQRAVRVPRDARADRERVQGAAEGQRPHLPLRGARVPHAAGDRARRAAAADRAALADEPLRACRDLSFARYVHPCLLTCTVSWNVYPVP